MPIQSETKPQKKIRQAIAKLPNSPGVYFFLGRPKRSEGGLGKNKKILYIGKATSLRNRVKSYFVENLAEKRSELIANMIEEIGEIGFQETSSVLEALILEANLIKKHLPPYNSALKDQKSWNYVVITKSARTSHLGGEDFPRVLIKRERELATSDWGLEAKFGPFTNGSELKEALKIVRRIFPYRDRCLPNTKACFNYQIGLCPGVCAGVISKKEYRKTIKHIELFFGGKTANLIKSLQKEMKEFAKKREFEKATSVKRKIFALNHINDIALIKNKSLQSSGHNLPTFRIEAYDIAHLSGTSVVGVVTVMEDGELKKSDYRKFKVKAEKNNDTAALREILMRRFDHSEWPYPDLIVVDGGQAQINTAKAELERRGIHIATASVVKDKHHKAREIMGYQFPGREREILLANNEAHRFALIYHRKLRGKLTI